MGLGLSGAFGAKAAADALRVMQQDALVRQRFAEQLKQQEFDNAIATAREARDAKLFTDVTHPRGVVGVESDREQLDFDRTLKRPTAETNLKAQQTVLSNLIAQNDSRSRLRQTNPNLGMSMDTGVALDELLTPEDRAQRSIQEGTRSGLKLKSEYDAGAGDVDKAMFGPGGPRAQTDKQNINLRGAWDLKGAELSANLRNTNRPPTGEQNTTMGYYTRLRHAIDNLNQTEDQLSAKDIAIIQNAPPTGIISNIATMGLSPAGQRYVQAGKEFTLAKLRKESGAAISWGEFANEAATYLRNNNDNAESLAQKREGRELVATGFARSAGPAYESYYGTPFTGGQSTQKTLTEADIQAAMKANKWTREQAVAEAQKRGYAVR